MIGTRRIYDEWTAESDPAHQKYIGLILRLSCGAAIPPKQRKWPKCSQSGADLRKSEQMGVRRTYKPDRARGTHRPRGMAYQRARVRDTRTGRPATRSAEHAGRGGGNKGDTTPGTGPNPPNRPRAPRTHRRGTAPAKAVVAHSATPQPLG